MSKALSQSKDSQWDLVVVGGGGAGLASAVSAAQKGLKVLLLERNAHVGGTTAMSVGSYTAAGSSLQKRKNIKDNPEWLVEDMWKFDEALLTGDSPTIRTLYAQQSARGLEWLISLGVAFSGPYPELPHRVNRMHNVIPNSKTYIVRLLEAAKKHGVTIVTNAQVGDLIITEGKACGVRYSNGGQELTAQSSGGVVLATGDFSGSKSLREKYLSDSAAKALPINQNALGIGHEIAVKHGASTLQMDRLFGPQLRFPTPSKGGFLNLLPTWKWLCKLEALIVNSVPTWVLKPVVKSLLVAWMSPTDAIFKSGGILVNQSGNRFGKESSPAAELAMQENCAGFIIIDETIAKKFNSAPNYISTAPGIAFAYFTDYKRGRPDLVTSAKTVKELAATIKTDVKNLEESIASSGLKAPFISLGPVYSMLTVTEGSLAINAKLQVLKDDGSVVKGLYAVGAVGQGGMLLKGHGHHIGWAMTSGMLAGEEVAQALKSQYSTVTS
jgi:fumarate reductase flavoprotein subunit